MDPSIGSIEVIDGFGAGSRATIRFAGTSDVQVPLYSWHEWGKRKFDLWNPDLGSTIERLAGRRLLSALEVLVARQPENAIQRITGDKTADTLPWEAFVEQSPVLSGLRSRFTPVRATSQEISTAAPAPSGMPRILLLVGEGGTAFDSDKVKSELGRSIVDRFSIAGRPAIDFRAEALADYALLGGGEAAHVVVVYAHGRSSPKPAVLAASQSWIPIDTLAEGLSKSVEMPPYWIFVSCELGENASADDLARHPEAFSALVARGAAMMIAMRSRIRPLVGDSFLLTLMDGLLGGQGVARACAEARDGLRRAGLVGGRWDWAAPAIWMNARPNDPIRWSDADAVGRERVGDGIAVLKAARENPAAGIASPDPSALERARAWIKGGRVFVAQDIGSVALPLELEQICIAGARFGRTVVPIFLMNGHSYADRLRNWAVSMRQALAPREWQSDLAKAVEMVAQGDIYDGFSRLLCLDEAMVVLSEAPGNGVQEAPFWHAIDEAPEQSIVVACGSPGRKFSRRSELWIDDRIYASEKLGEEVDQVMTLSSRSMMFMAVLRRPVSIDRLGEIFGEDNDALRRGDLLIEDTGYRHILSDSARTFVRSRMTDADVRTVVAEFVERQAKAATALLAGDHTEELRLLIEAGLDQEAILTANRWAVAEGHSWSTSEWARFADVFAGSTAIKGLAEDVRLWVAEMLARKQHLDAADEWLLGFRASTSQNSARQKAVQSEIFKGRAEVAAMWRHARAAVSALDDGSDPAMQHRFRMNLARLKLYFDKDPATACEAFEGILADIGDPEDAAQAELYGALKRNLAEALFEFEPFGMIPDYERARRHLVEAIAVANHHKLGWLEAECTYSLAKLEEARPQIDSALDDLERCAQAALDAHHFVAFRIARLRQYRVRVDHKGVIFSSDAFRAWLRPLDVLTDHAWAARYSAQSRFWAAKSEYRRDFVESAQGYLEQIVDMSQLAGLSTDGDTAFLGRVDIGLRAICRRSGKDSAAYDAFSSQSRIREWVEQNESAELGAWE